MLITLLVIGSFCVHSRQQKLPTELPRRSHDSNMNTAWSVDNSVTNDGSLCQQATHSSFYYKKKKNFVKDRLKHELSFTNEPHFFKFFRKFFYKNLSEFYLKKYIPKLFYKIFCLIYIFGKF